jgi:hypothetical protein
MTPCRVLRAPPTIKAAYRAMRTMLAAMVERRDGGALNDDLDMTAT